MEKSIESIWKEGFLKNDVLVAPKVNDIYNKKSEHIVDKFTRMFKININAIFIGSFVVVLMSYAVRIPYMGIGMFLIVNTLAFINIRLKKGLSKIDKNVNSFQYLKTFDSWMKEQTRTNERFARLLYPLIFIAMVAGFWFGPIGGDVPGDSLVNSLISRFPDLTLVLGVPLYLWLAGFFIIALLAYFGGKIYRWDLNIVYGRVLKKLDEIIADMEELRK
jgi:hypothetical protein